MMQHWFFQLQMKNTKNNPHLFSNFQSIFAIILALSYQSIACALPPPDTNEFLEMLNKNPLLAESEETATAYYAAVDPENQRKTLQEWQLLNGFGNEPQLTADAFAIYINDADLGFARRMYLLTKDSGDDKDNIASCVENYLTIDDAIAQNGVLATVCMEWSPAPDGSNGGRRYTKFFTYDENNNLALGADLDGRGFKYQPGLCLVCHGGSPKPPDAGVYPDHGEVGAFFLPWDLDTFKYSETVPSLSRAAQESEFKKFNQAVLSTYPAPATYRYTGPAAPIPDNSLTGVEVSLLVSGGPDQISNLILSIDGVPNGIPGLEHPRIIDLQVFLTSPQGTTVSLMGFNKNGANLRDTYIHDRAEKNIFSFNYPFDFPPYTGTYMPFGSGKMDSFLGENPNGIWTITVKDLVASNTGSINQWSLYFNGEPVLPVGSVSGVGTVQDLRVPAPVELIEGWYGGSGMPSATFDGTFVPKGWLPPIAPANAAELYLKVVGPTCRACHIQRGTLRRGEIDFSTYADFLAYADRTQQLVYGAGVMPLAKRTFDHFWETPGLSTLLAQHLPDCFNCIGTKPGLLIVKTGAPPERDVPLNRRVNLDGRGSLFANTFEWSFLQKPAGSTNVITGADTAQASFVPDVEGSYLIMLLITGNDQINSTGLTVVASAATSPISYEADIAPILTNFATCGLNCHSGSTDLVNFQSEENARRLVDPIYPRESLLLRKPSWYLPHAGAIRPDFGNSGANYTLIENWILEGICSNGDLQGLDQCDQLTVPTTPVITNTAVGDGEIYLSVSVASNGGSPITGYTATCNDGTTQYTGTSSTSRITVSGLTNGEGYSCSVTATNAAGTSQASEVSSVTPAGDVDGDGVNDLLDNCVSIANPGQEPSAINPNCGEACVTSSCAGTICVNH
jgi:subtilisin-like proprotein convertase family protein